MFRKRGVIDCRPSGRRRGIVTVLALSSAAVGCDRASQLPRPSSNDVL